ncbi:hypothetical protein X777_10701 [Ooceraea biroi]|uniref:Uncharacterized protein n=1 Tax=Ooceraea biroi TaxID=2015173 RepID=A0A026W3A7_OOCBI|nr:hypothetical protein X777_10701 [Ooceraea biroi]
MDSELDTRKIVHRSSKNLQITRKTDTYYKSFDDTFFIADDSPFRDSMKDARVLRFHERLGPSLEMSISSDGTVGSQVRKKSGRNDEGTLLR